MSLGHMYINHELEGLTDGLVIDQRSNRTLPLFLKTIPGTKLPCFRILLLVYVWDKDCYGEIHNQDLNHRTKAGIDR